MQLHDSVPGAVRRVDRVDVGLLVRLWPHVHPLLPRRRPHRLPRHPQPLRRPPPQQLLGSQRRYESMNDVVLINPDYTEYLYLEIHFTRLRELALRDRDHAT